MAMTSARSGNASKWHRLFSRAISQSLKAFVVPDTRTARAFGLDLAAAGLDVASNPRHASVLLVVGDLPEGLSNAASIVYAQMPRPRAIMTVGTTQQNQHFPPDISISLDQKDLIDGVRRLQSLFLDAAWSPVAQDFEASILADAGSTDDDDTHAHTHHGGMHDNGSSAGANGNQKSSPDEAHDEEHDARHDMSAGSGHDHGEASTSMPHTSGDPATSSTGSSGPADHAPFDNMVSDHAAIHHEDHASSTSATATHDDHASTHHEAVNHDMHAMGQGKMSHDTHAMQQRDSPHHTEISHDGHSMDHSDHMMNHGGHSMDHSDHMMDDSGFMSMIAMTQGLPRSRDGLPMEWVEAGFGPLFPGLPGGFAPVLTLDGDVVAKATVTPGVTHRGVLASLSGPVTTLPDRLQRLDPFTPITYRQLAMRAIASIEPARAVAPEGVGGIGALERERACSHLGWLSAFAELLGNAWMADRAAELHLDLVRAQDLHELDRLRPIIDRFLHRAVRAPLLRRRLRGIGTIAHPAATNASGPVRRASGHPIDAREDESPYQALKFHPVQHGAGDAFARMWVRVQEIEQSLDLVAAAGSLTLPSLEISPYLWGMGVATLETPRGTATLHIEVHEGEVHSAHLEAPSATQVTLLSEVTEGAELADALTAIASLDLSPWEIDA